MPFSRSLLVAACLAAGLSMVVSIPVARADNPIIQTRFTADPAPFVHDGVVYLYTSHDEDDTQSGFKMLDWRLYSSTDMVNWTDRGVVASLKTFPWAVQSNDAWAPQVIARDGKFYLYAPISMAGSPKNVIAVAVADRPEGPFRDAIGKPLIAPGNGYIDPTVWIDDDGQAYLYWGNPSLWYVKLNRDMVSYSGPIQKVVQPADYQEGPWFYKREGHYYMAYASTCCPEGIGYAMSKGPTGPWVHKGKIMDPSPRSTGNHPGIIDYKGKSYLFGFHYELNFDMTPVHHERRSINVTSFTYNADGTIPKQPWWDTKGAAQIAPVDAYGQVEAETIAWTSRIKRDRDRPYDWAPGVLTAADEARGMIVTRTTNRSYIKVAGVDFGKHGARRFVASVSNALPGATIELRVDGLTGPVIGTLAVGATGAAGQWQEQSTKVSGARGVRDLFILFKGKGDDERSLLDFDYWRFAK